MYNENLQTMIERYKKQLIEFSQKSATQSSFNMSNAYEQSVPAAEVFAHNDEREYEEERQEENNENNNTYPGSMPDTQQRENAEGLTPRTPREQRRDAGELWGLNGLRDIDRFRNGYMPIYDSQVWDMNQEENNNNRDNIRDNNRVNDSQMQATPARDNSVRRDNNGVDDSQMQEEAELDLGQRRYIGEGIFFERETDYEEMPERQLTSIEAEYESFDEFLAINPSRGSLKVEVYAADRAFPITNARVVVLKSIAGKNYAFYDVKTNMEGIVDNLVLPTKSWEGFEGVAIPFTGYSVAVEHPDYENTILRNVLIFDNIKSVLPVEMEPFEEDSVQPGPVSYDQLLYMTEGR